MRKYVKKFLRWIFGRSYIDYRLDYLERKIMEQLNEVLNEIEAVKVIAKRVDATVEGLYALIEQYTASGISDEAAALLKAKVAELKSDVEAYESKVPFSTLQGLTLLSVTQEGDDRIIFKSADGRTFIMGHLQDCCERVSIESVVGDLSDLVGNPILIAEESTSSIETKDGVVVEEPPVE